MRQVMVSPKHKMLGVPYSDDIKNLFPQSRELTIGGKRTLLVPHHPTETFMLRKFGFDAPSPVLSHYEWTGMSQPFEVQKQTVAMLTMNNRAYVLNGMGTGKTKSALWAYDYLRKEGMAKKALVLAPLSTLRFTWQREVFATTPHLKCAVVHGTRAKRKEIFASDADVYIINHDGLQIIESDLEARDDIDMVIIDELAVYRNPKAARTKLLSKVAKGMKWVWGMTGAPIPNSPTDAWAQAHIVTPHTVPTRFTHFRDQLMYKVSQFKWLPKPDAVESAFEALQPAVRYKLDDVMELPEAIIRTLDVDLGSTQKKIYTKMANDCYAAVASQEITAANAAAAMVKLMQISCGWVYSETKGVVGLDNDSRLDALVDAIDATDEKVLVFVPFKHALKGISDRLTKEGIEHATVSGDTTMKRRSELFNLFQNTDKYKVIVAHPQCFAHGVTLTAASTIVWFSPTTSLEIYEQANARIRRVGQKHKQLFLHLQSTPVERRIYSMLQQKQKVQDKLLELFEGFSAENKEK